MPGVVESIVAVVTLIAEAYAASSTLQAIVAIIQIASAVAVGLSQQDTGNISQGQEIRLK